MTIPDGSPAIPESPDLRDRVAVGDGRSETVSTFDLDEPSAFDEGVADKSVNRVASGARAFFDWAVVIAVALLVAFVVRGFVLAHFVVEGQSMATTLDTGDRVFVNKLSYRLHDPNRGDVVVLHQITDASERDLIKRVVALPGETIEMTGCVVRITAPGGDAPQILDEPYLDERDKMPGDCGSDITSQVVPADHVFVMGDNRGGSQDSRNLGPIAEDDLVGRAFVVFWPFDHLQWL